MKAPTPLKSIQIRGARTHNLRNINLDIPRDRLVVLTGLSGSGKSSLAFDTLYAEGQRRYVESLSTYARQFLSVMDKPDVDHIEGLSPAISIEQKSSSHNPRSTVGTITEIYDYLRLLYARIGLPHCPDHGLPLRAQTVSQISDSILALPGEQPLLLMAPLVKERKGEHLQLLEKLLDQGYVRARINGAVVELDRAPRLDKNRKHTIEVVVDRFRVRADTSLRNRIADSLETALDIGQGIVCVAPMDGDGEELLFSALFSCPECGFSIDAMEPSLFSFNSPLGACPECDGLGLRRYFDVQRIVPHPEATLAEGAIIGWDRRHFLHHAMLRCLARHYGFDMVTPFEELPEHVRNILLHGSGNEIIDFHFQSRSGSSFRRKRPFEGVIPNLKRRFQENAAGAGRGGDPTDLLSDQICPTCEGTRLCRSARHVRIQEHSLSEVTAMTVADAEAHFHALKLEGGQKSIADKILKEVRARLSFLLNVGLNYLSLSRSATTLSGGEAQRIRLASQIGSGLVGVAYILDEPSIGLHQRDNARLIKSLTQLRDLGNTVLMVEHDESTIRSADHVVDMGPGAGVLGGKVVAQGSVRDITRNEASLTGQYLRGSLSIPVPAQRTPTDKDRVLRLEGARGHNLRDINLELPLGLFTCVTGVSGSGKSTLVNATLYPSAARALNRAERVVAAPHRSIEGLREHLDKCINIDQSPIGRTPRSNPATYTELFTPIRELFAGTQEARARGYKPGRFSFNVGGTRGGRCAACQGDGVTRVAMHFLPDVYVPCDICKGKRYNRETLDIHYKGKNIAEILALTVDEGAQLFRNIPTIARKLQTLQDVGLGYIQLGQSATTLSGGEAQRIKLSRELSRQSTGRTLYILDEPTTGLHFHDVRQLLEVLLRLRDQGNTIVVIEHNLDVIKTADWIVDLGPEGGAAGGAIVAAGTPEEVATHKESHTGLYLAELLPAPAVGVGKAKPARGSKKTPSPSPRPRKPHAPKSGNSRTKAGSRRASPGGGAGDATPATKSTTRRPRRASAPRAP